MGNSNSVLNGHRAKLSKVGKKLLDECVEDCVKANKTEEETVAVIQERIAFLTEKHSLPPIRLINYEDMVRVGGFPRCPENENVTCDLAKIDRNNSFLVFISHCWMRGYSGAEGYVSQPHPDNAEGDKYRMCVKGIEILKNVFAPRTKNCYVWLDFGCINQNGNPAGELEQLDKIVQCCDCIFTPVVDHDHQKWVLPMGVKNIFKDYKAKLWNDGPHAYLNRGWCRVEMLYAANIPVQENENSDVKRHTMFEAGLAYHCSKNRRPHFLYGTKEYEQDNYIPHLLPPLQYSYLINYHPLNANFSVASDVEHIQTLIDELQPYLDANKIEVGYKGDTEAGKRNGYGIERYANGNVYEGEWKDDKKNGHGTYRHADGAVYEGEFKANKKHGHGILHQTEGTMYDGEWKEDIIHGHGTYRYADGAVYEGERKDGKMNGQGTMTYAEGDRYEGEWREGEMHGMGTMNYSDGNEYVGEWKEGKKHGHGRCRCDGVVIEGEWRNDEAYGRGTMTNADGIVKEGEWKDDSFVVNV